MSRSLPRNEIPEPVARPYPLSRAWCRCVVVTEVVLAAIYIACTIWLIVRSPTSGPMITAEVGARFIRYCVGRALWVFMGYMLIGLGLGSFACMLLWSLCSIRGRRMSPRLALWGSLAVVLGILSYKAVFLSVFSPSVLTNMLQAGWGVRLVGAIGDHVPAWLVAGLRGLTLAAACVLVVGGLARSLSRMQRLPRLAAVAASAVLLTAVGGLGLGLALERLPAASRDDGRPNILILATDGLQSEHLGIYGYDRPTSPNIDRLGADGVRLTQCYVPLARTLVSWTSILTGTYPHTHGLRHTWPRELNIDVPVPTLCRELRKKGYASAVFADWAGSDFGKVNYGFDRKQVAREAWSLSTWISQATCQGHPLLVAFGGNGLGYVLYPEIRGMPVNPAPDAVTHAALGALEDFAQQRQPFFMIVFYSETHLPYATRYPYYRRFTDPAYDGLHKSCVYVPDPREAASGRFDPEACYDVDQVRALYDGAVLSFDDQVGVIVRSLKDLNLWDDTIVIVSSDHGEDILESPHSWGHGHYFFGDDYDSRIPVIINDPALRGRGPARTIDEPASSIDLMPTLLERVGLPAPETCEGESLLDLIQGRRAERDRTVFAETGVLMGGGREISDSGALVYPSLIEMFEVADMRTGQVGIRGEYSDLLIEARHRMLRTSRWKLVYIPLVAAARYQLYDIRSDPECRRDVKDAYPAVFDDLKARLWRWIERDALRRRQDDHVVGRPAA